MSILSALKLKNETAVMFYKSGKGILPKLNTPPELCQPLVSYVSAESKLFLRKMWKFNSCFQITSVGATKIVQTNDFYAENDETKNIVHELV